MSAHRGPASRLKLNGSGDRRFREFMTCDPVIKNIRHGHSIGGVITPEYHMWMNAGKKARKEGLPFSISVHDIKIPETCPILGIPLVCHKGARNIQGDSPSLDKIVPEDGYVPGNIWVISFRANRIKCDASLAELILIADALAAEIEARQIAAY